MNRLLRLKVFEDSRFRIALFLSVSAAVSLGATVLTYVILRYFYRQISVNGDTLYQIRMLINNIGDMNALAVFFLPLFLIIYLLLMRKYDSRQNGILKTKWLKFKLFKSFRIRIMMFLFMSAVISLALTGVIYYILAYYYRQNAVSGDMLHQIRMLINNIGEINVFSVVFLPLFFITYLLLTRKYGRQLDDISKAISQISAGNFNVDIPVESDDEIGVLARDVNAAAKKLRSAVETGEFAKSSKDRLVVNIAHDLRTPLTSINGYLGLIIHQENLTEAQIKHYAEIAYKKSDNMERLIEALFDFSRFNYGENKLNKEKIDVVMLVKQIMEEFYPSLKEKGLEGRIIAEDDAVFIEADGYLLARVFDNLISNALRYGAEGKYIDAEITRDQNNAVISIINYDTPIPAEELSHIFESFYRVEKSRSTLTGGAGLGLAIAKNIIDLHGGEISAQSDLLKTVFEIRLALATDSHE